MSSFGARQLHAGMGGSNVHRKVFCTVALLIILSQASAQVAHQHLFDTIPFLPAHHNNRVRQFSTEKIVTGQIIFLGNSITEGGPWSELLPGLQAINRGIGGDITFGILKRLDEIVGRKPAKVFLLIGINDIAMDIPVDVIADNCRKIISKLKARSPDTKVYLQSILPVNPAVVGFPQHYDKEDKVLRANILLRDVAASAGVVFVNLYPLFLDSQQRLDTRFTRDGLHLNHAAYQRWVAFLKETGCL